MERLGIRFPVAEIAEKTGFDQGNISAYYKGKKPLSDNFLTSFKKAYGIEGEIVNASSGFKIADDSTVGTLARALADQAEANKIQAAANDKYAEGFRALAIILERVESKMARENTQATISDKIDELAASLADAKEVDLLAAKYQQKKFAEIADLLLQAGSGKKTPSPGEGKRQGENGGGVHKPRKKH